MKLCFVFQYILKRGEEKLVEYYAKSKPKLLSAEEKRKLKENLEQFREEFHDELADWEKAYLPESEEEILSDSRDQDLESPQKTLKEHTEEVIACAKEFFEQYGCYFTEKEKILVIESCRNHDLGKVNKLFQQKVMFGKKNDEEIPHGYLSAVSISKKDFLKQYPEMTPSDFYIMITAIYYHHTRNDDYKGSQIREYCEKYYESAIREYLGNNNWKINNSNRNHLLFKTNGNQVPEEQQWNQYLLVKGLLNKFDWCASAEYKSCEISPDLQVKQLKKKIEMKQSNLRPAQIYMKEKTEDNLIVIAPTGSGKTEAALLWLNGEKGFYTLPLKVSSNAIYDRIREQYEYEPVCLLHSDSLARYLNEANNERTAKDENEVNNGYERYERAKLLSAPLTICTVDQLFKFVYKALGTEIFPATLKYSKLILDEIQSYSPRVVAAILYGLKTIIQMGGHFAIITATFPAVLKVFLERYGIREGREYQFCDFSQESTLKRHIVDIREGEMDVNEIIENGKNKKVLVICNTIAKAQMLYEQIEELQIDNVYLLHSLFIRQDRALLEECIKNFSKNIGIAGIWITTQIVEASLDIDFDILYTEMCTADSLLQRMGRCNRTGRYLPQVPNVIVYNNRSGVGRNAVYDKDLYERSLEHLKDYIGVIFSEKSKTKYINVVYKEDEIKTTTYYQDIKYYLKKLSELPPAEYSKQEADEQFRLIESITVIPECIYNEKKEIFEKCHELLSTPHIPREVRAILNRKMENLTLSINVKNRWKYPDGVDQKCIEGTFIHRARLQYDFDTSSLKGKGLVLTKVEDEDFII